MAHIRQSRPDYGLDFQVKVFKPFSVVPSSLASGAVSVVPLLVAKIVGFGVWGSGFRVQSLGFRV